MSAAFNKIEETSKKESEQALVTDKTVRMLANSIYETLKKEGCQNKDIIGVSSQLIGLVTEEINRNHNNRS